MGADLRPCTESEALEILRDPSVLPYLSVYPVGLKDVEAYLMDEKALVIVIPMGDEAEVHIACKRKDRAFLRESIKSGLKWLKERGFVRVFTTAPDHRKALTNMLQSLDFKNLNGRWVWE